MSADTKIEKLALVTQELVPDDHLGETEPMDIIQKAPIKTNAQE